MTPVLPAITITPLQAALVAIGFKRVVGRPKGGQLKRAGYVAIVAAGDPQPWDVGALANVQVRRALAEAGFLPDSDRQARPLLPEGAVVAIARVRRMEPNRDYGGSVWRDPELQDARAGVRELLLDDWLRATECWFLGEVVRLLPVVPLDADETDASAPSLGAWPLPTYAAAQVDQQLTKLRAAQGAAVSEPAA